METKIFNLWLSRIKKNYKEYFCNHDYRLPKPNYHKKLTNELKRGLKKDEKISFLRLHICIKCKKKKYLKTKINGETRN